MLNWQLITKWRWRRLTNFLTISALIGLSFNYGLKAEELESKSRGLEIALGGDSSVDPISNCQRLLSKARSMELVRTHIDYALREKWLKSQDIAPSSLLFLKWLSDKIKILSTEEILANVETSFRKFLSKDKYGNLVFLVEENGQQDGNKSGAWLTGFIKNRFPEYRSSPVVSDRHLNDPKFVNYLLLHPDVQIVAVDDIAYSGLQLLTLTNRLINSGRISRDRVHVVIGDITAKAEQIFIDAKLDFTFTGLLKNVGDLIDDEPESLRQTLNRELELFSRHSWFGLKEFSLTMTDYKAPDIVSFPSFLRLGSTFEYAPGGKKYQVRQAQGAYISVPFISHGTPPYKQVPYLDPNSGF